MVNWLEVEIGVRIVAAGRGRRPGEAERRYGIEDGE